MEMDGGRSGWNAMVGVGGGGTWSAVSRDGRMDLLAQSGVASWRIKLIGFEAVVVVVLLLMVMMMVVIKGSLS
jgi:hypothetical protein